jgi:hypothetical protein
MSRKTIPQCTNHEIKGFLISGSIIASIMGIMTFVDSSQTSSWLLWGVRCIRVYVVIWLVSLWYQALRELHLRKKDPSRGPR